MHAIWSAELKENCVYLWMKVILSSPPKNISSLSADCELHWTNWYVLFEREIPKNKPLQSNRIFFFFVFTWSRVFSIPSFARSSRISCGSSDFFQASRKISVSACCHFLALFGRTSWFSVSAILNYSYFSQTRVQTRELLAPNSNQVETSIFRTLFSGSDRFGSDLRSYFL